MMDGRLRVRIAWGTAPYAASPTWDDISDDCLSVKAKTDHRTNEFDSFRAGTATITLADFAREYDPTYASSPHAGNFTFGCPIVVQGDDGGTWRTVWSGYVWRFTPGAQTGKPTCTITARGPLALFADHWLEAVATPTGVGDEPADRISSVLTEVGWSVFLRVGGVSGTRLQPTTYGRSALAEMVRSAQAAGGLLYFVDDVPAVVFEDRHAVAASTFPRMGTSQRTFGTGGTIDIIDGSLRIEGVGDLYRNRVKITREGTESVSTAGTLGAGEAERAVSRTVPLDYDVDAQAVADFLHDLYATETPAPISWASTAHYAQSAADDDCLRVRLRDRVTVAWTPYVGATESHEVLVNGITHTITPEQWRVTYVAESADPYDDNVGAADWLVLGTDQLDQEKLGY